MDTNVISKFVFELRFTPKPSIIDKRGQITEFLRQIGYKKWQIDKNSIQLTHTDIANLLVVVSYKSIGMEYTGDLERFLRHFHNFITQIASFIPAEDYRRLGFRSLNYIKTSLSFEESLRLLHSKVLSSEKSLTDNIGKKLIDSTFSLNFQDEDRYINLNLGIMNDVEAHNKLDISNDIELDEVGLVIDIDMFIKATDEENLSLRFRDLKKTVGEFAINTKSKVTTLSELILLNGTK